MRARTLRWLVSPGVFLLMSSMANAQGDSATAAPAVELRYRSTFDGYRAYNEQAVTSWREANDNVGRIGGWRAYAREAGASGGDAPAPAPVPAPVPAPQPDHGNNAGKGGKP